MELSPEQFVEIACKPVTGRQLRGEKRGATRIPFGRRSTIQTESGVVTVVIRELSVTGASLVASQAMPVGERLILGVPRINGPDLQVKCSVLRCDRGTGGHVFVVGLKFEEVVQSPVAAPLSSPAVKGESSDVTRIRQALLGA